MAGLAPPVALHGLGHVRNDNCGAARCDGTDLDIALLAVTIVAADDTIFMRFE